jgi:hypothetical protein
VGKEAKRGWGGGRRGRRGAMVDVTLACYDPMPPLWLHPLWWLRKPVLRNPGACEPSGLLGGGQGGEEWVRRGQERAVGGDR